MVIECYSALAQDTIYINPSYEKQHQTGSKEFPFHSWDNIKQEYGYTYLQLRGTVDTVDHIFLNTSDITLGAYGEGSKPVIYFNTQHQAHGIMGWQRENISIQNLELIAPQGKSCIYFNEGNLNWIVDSCIIHESEWGIRITSGNNSYHRILRTEIYNIIQDGIFVQDAHNIEIAFCFIHNVNAKWIPPHTSEKIAAGDGVQFSRCNQWHVHHNIIDRSNSGNKFCFISNNPLQNEGVLEYNTFYAPQKYGNCIFFGSGTNLIVRYNYFYGNKEVTALYNHSMNLEIYYNIFISFDLAVHSLHDSVCSVINNTFYLNKSGLSGYNILSKNNIFHNTNLMELPYIKVRKLKESHNHFTVGGRGNESTRGEPHFVDAENQNFKLLNISPCVNSGAIHNIPSDLSGMTVPNENQTDKGAFEHY
ncbi:MAG: right-handed parallel beta-helix repeat-containing protein [bacterium]